MDGILSFILESISSFDHSVLKAVNSTMRSGLESKLKTTADFFENYVSASGDDFYNSIYRFTQDFDEKILEHFFVILDFGEGCEKDVVRGAGEGLDGIDGELLCLGIEA